MAQYAIGFVVEAEPDTIEPALHAINTTFQFHDVWVIDVGLKPLGVDDGRNDDDDLSAVAQDD